MANKYLKEESELFELEPKSVLNPLNAFRVIKKLAKTWEEISKEIQSDLAENYLKNISNQRETRFPNEDDLNGAIQGLLRLQDTYKLKTKDLANGIVEDININKQMDDPLYPNATNNSKLYEQELLANGVNEEDFRSNIPPLNNTRMSSGYEELCRGENEISITEISKLYCYYKMDRPFLRLAPIKVEIIRFEPLAVIFRNVIYDEEIEIMQNISLPKLQRSLLINYSTGVSSPSRYRVSKNAWISVKIHPIVKQIAKRLKLMTNLNLKSAEPLQDSNFTMETGDRIATVLFYLSTPKKGGYTVFTDIKTVAKPTKNDALFWYNMLRSVDIDWRTRHAACPVLLGDKWAMNCFIHEKSEEFVRPCGLDPSIEERYVGDLGGPEPRKYPNISPYCNEG
uniref:procollagen-proline 4-dioxygenase n=1 Tax=Meloidogyne floridensis TaxID=298350 RepID=A0A915P4K2_9BILA